MPNTKPQAPQLPTSVKIGAHAYGVTVDANDWKDWEHEQKHSGLCGGSEHQRLMIYLNPALARSQMQETLLHECMHAMYYASGLQTSAKGSHEDVEEVVVVALTPWVHSLLCDNPDLVAYLTWQP
jgi:uncharacterized protein YjaZ